MKEREVKAGYIIRWTKPIRFPDGTVSNMACRRGTRSEMEKFAESVASENGAEVEAIV